jgi:hypothetical protein
LKLAILGASGIGKFHARTFDKLNVEVNAILSSSKVTGKATSQDLKDSLGLKVNYYDDLDMLLNKSMPDAVTICTPNELHYEQILKVLDKKIPIFCEKPLFWNKKDNYKAFSKKLKVISDHPNRAIFVNTSGAGYVKSIKNLLPLSKDLNSFNFNFITQGNNKYLEIAEDLMPHGLAMLIELFGCHDITSFKQEYSENAYKCNFYYSGCKVNFDFKEGKLFKKEFVFSVNEKKYVRIQNRSLKNYEVFLDCISQNRKIKIDDPFEVYASRFINFCTNVSNFQKDEFNESSYNLNLMAKILLIN